ncbi:hypothetical protein Hanom_Chr10g00955941 [Helianthus anomalus]
MFSNLSRSCVRGRTSEHGMRQRIMLKSPCSKHLTRVLQTNPMRPRTTPVRRGPLPCVRIPLPRVADHSRASADHSRASMTTSILDDSSGVVRRRTGVVCRTWMHQHNMRTLPKLSGPSKDAGG